MKVIDLSHFMHHNMPIFPDSPPPRFHQIANLKEDGYVETQIILSSHLGTHIDAPFHMIQQGKALYEYEITSFVGNAVIVDITENQSGLIEIKDLKEFEEKLLRADFLLFNSGWSKYWGEEKYFRGYPVLRDEAAKWLSHFKLKGIGIDMISVDHIDSSTYPNHQIFFDQNILIIENLTNLADIDSEFFTFCCFPLKFEESDASPVRAVGIIK